jgi:hypothetical protein
VTPTANSNAASKGPASGNSTTHNPTEIGGPMIKHTSSSTDSRANAVWSLGWPRYSSVQRARTMADMLGMQPASAANTNNAQFGACKRVHSNSNNNAPPPISAAIGSTLPWL